MATALNSTAGAASVQADDDANIRFAYSSLKDAFDRQRVALEVLSALLAVFLLTACAGFVFLYLRLRRLRRERVTAAAMPSAAPTRLVFDIPPSEYASPKIAPYDFAPYTEVSPQSLPPYLSPQGLAATLPQKGQQLAPSPPATETEQRALVSQINAMLVQQSPETSPSYPAPVMLRGISHSRTVSHSSLHRPGLARGPYPPGLGPSQQPARANPLQLTIVPPSQGSPSDSAGTRTAVNSESPATATLQPPPRVDSRTRLSVPVTAYSMAPSPATGPFEYPLISTLLDRSDAAVRALGRYKRAFEEQNYYRIDELRGMDGSELCARIPSMTRGNADFVCRMVQEELDWIDSERGRDGDATRNTVDENAIKVVLSL